MDTDPDFDDTLVSSSSEELEEVDEAALQLSMEQKLEAIGDQLEAFAGAGHIADVRSPLFPLGISAAEMYGQLVHISTELVQRKVSAGKRQRLGHMNLILA